MLKIGIIVDSATSPWVDGASQNAFFIKEIIKKIGFNVDIVSFKNNTVFFKEEVKHIYLSDIKYYDIFLNTSEVLEPDYPLSILSQGKKIISIKHHNTIMMLIDSLNNKKTEKYLINKDRPYESRSLWISTKQSRFIDTYEALYKANIKVFPFLWDPYFLINYDDNFHKDSFIKNKDQLKKIAVFETNQNFYKNLILPLTLCESLNFKNKNLLDSIYIGSSDIIKDNLMFQSFAKKLTLFSENKILFTKKYPLYSIFKNNIGNTVVSNQIYNEDNYIYLETLFYNRPLIHNNLFMKDTGYYYNGMNIENGSNLLNDCILNFNISDHIDNYQKTLFKYSIDNIVNQEIIKDLLEKEINE